ncbi:MAG: Tm-1-like ATP-binding domain-containing protein [Actinomycetota bacterium]|jgi:uncharacterized protein (UPF0261 family)|nr:Tm-1-like ATP-binding domain-containing protein [Actinomycetota bacterium]
MNDKKPNILCIGVLDTKGDEIKFLARECQKLGANAKIMELSLGGEVGWADISLSEVLAEDGIHKEDVFKASRTEAIEIVGKAGAKKMAKLYEEGQVDGVIAWSGSVGTTVSTMTMRALPIGVPKIMLSTCAASDVSSWLGSKDIYISNPISEKGVNRVTRKIVANATAAIVAMAKVGEISEKEAKPLAAVTAYGTTTPAVMRLSKYMEEKRGFDTITIHQVGTGATMEDLIRSRMITAVYDITIGELSNNYYGSIYGIDPDWEGERLTAASDMGIPQIVCPGGLAQCAYGPLKTMPGKIMEEYKQGKRVSYQNSREPYIHNSAVTIIAPTLEETELFATEIIEKLNRTTGPTALVLPLRGWSAYDQSVEQATVERGWAKEKGDGPVWIPDPDNPKWSKRATTMWNIFKQKIDKDNPNLDLIVCNNHILDIVFTDFLNRIMGDMLDGRWTKGSYRDMENIVE